MIDLAFLGGARTVTGSKHLLRTSRATVLLECGLFQGRRKESIARNRAIPVPLEQLDAVVLSHAHVDHSGALPVLTKRGYTGAIYATPATRDLCAPMLEDAARIQAADAAHIDRLIARGIEDLEPVQPLYDRDDVLRCLECFVGLPYHRRQTIAPGVELTFLDAGHVLGSAIVVLDIADDDRRVRIAFTGDLGRGDSPLLRTPEVPKNVGCLITESTYGDRRHAAPELALETFARAINRTIERGGKVIIPAFALERAQEVIFSLKLLRHTHRIPAVPVYVDSPLAVRVTDVFRLHPECVRREAFNLDASPFEFEGLTYVSDVETSKAIDEASGPAIIIAGSGMCEGGRVLHHLRAWIEDARTTVIMVGYQAEHTLGRRLVEQRREVRIFGVMRDRHADVVSVDGLSAHADQHGLLDYAEQVRTAGNLEHVILVHGEPRAQDALAALLETATFRGIHVPEVGDRVEL